MGKKGRIFIKRPFKIETNDDTRLKCTQPSVPEGASLFLFLFKAAEKLRNLPDEHYKSRHVEEKWAGMSSQDNLKQKNGNIAN